MSNRRIYLVSDVIYDKNSTDPTDMNHLNTIANALKAKGFDARIYGDIGAGAHISDLLKTSPVDPEALVVEIAGGVDSGSIYEKGDSWYKGLLGNRRDIIVLLFSHPTMPMITKRLWLPRSPTDNYDNTSFIGIAHPDEYLLSNGYSYIEDVTMSDLDKIVDFIGAHAAFVDISLTKADVQNGIIRVNNFYSTYNRIPKTVRFSNETLSFEDFTRLVMFNKLNYNFLQYGEADVITEPTTEA